MTTIATVAPHSHAQRRERQLAMCQRLAELGMELAEAVQREALREVRPAPEPRRLTMPGMPDLVLPSMAPVAGDTCGQLFAQICRCVRQAILLEARLDSGAFDLTRPRAQAWPAAHDVQPAEPALRALCRPGDLTRLETERLEDDLAGQAHRPAADILGDVAAELGAVAGARTPAAPPHPAAEARARPSLPPVPPGLSSPPARVPSPSRPKPFGRPPPRPG